jgi:hypothetical protein
MACLLYRRWQEMAAHLLLLTHTANTALNVERNLCAMVGFIKSVHRTSKPYERQIEI